MRIFSLHRFRGAVCGVGLRNQTPKAGRHNSPEVNVLLSLVHNSYSQQNGQRRTYKQTITVIDYQLSAIRVIRILRAEHHQFSL
jgi:hypothetical protein